MKIQFEQQQLRIRIDEAEFARLLDRQPVTSTSRLPGVTLTLALQPVGDDAIAMHGDAGQLTVLLPIAALLAYQQRLPCRDGLAATQTLVDGTPLELALEVDVRDSVRVRGPRPKQRAGT